MMVTRYDPRLPERSQDNKGGWGRMTKYKSWTWKCPECKRTNEWRWERREIPKCGEVLLLTCEHCKAETKMVCKMKRVKE